MAIPISLYKKRFDLEQKQNRTPDEETKLKKMLEFEKQLIEEQDACWRKRLASRTPEEIKKAEDWVNDVIKKDLPMQYKEMPYEEAKQTGALHFFKEKYPEKVKVYFAGESLEKAVSKEFCGGPHVSGTGEIGKFKIIKEEAVGAGVRRIRGVLG